MPQVLMPQLGETVTEGTVGRWLKKAGETVAKYEPLLEVETDKVASEIPSPFAGTLSAILAEEGTTVPVGAPVCEILAAGEAPSATPAAVPKAAEESVAPLAKEAPIAFASAAMQAAQAPAASPQAAPIQAEMSSAAASDPSTANNGARHSPAVRRLARMHHIDLSGVPGSGRGGRLTARDVIAHVESGAAKTAASVAPPIAPKPQPTLQPQAPQQPAPTPSPATAAAKMVAPPPSAPQPASASHAPAAPAATPAASGTLIKVPAA